MEQDFPPTHPETETPRGYAAIVKPLCVKPQEAWISEGELSARSPVSSAALLSTENAIRLRAWLRSGHRYEIVSGGRRTKPVLLHDHVTAQKTPSHSLAGPRGGGCCRDVSYVRSQGLAESSR